jgi:hypothetical protein
MADDLLARNGERQKGRTAFEMASPGIYGRASLVEEPYSIDYSGGTKAKASEDTRSTFQPRNQGHRSSSSYNAPSSNNAPSFNNAPRGSGAHRPAGGAKAGGQKQGGGRNATMQDKLRELCADFNGPKAYKEPVSRGACKNGRHACSKVTDRTNGWLCRQFTHGEYDHK